MIHRGEIVKKAIENSGISITQIAKRMKKSRQWVYDQFENPTVPIETVFLIGSIIQYDFSEEVRSLNLLHEKKTIYTKSSNNSTLETEINWKEKYYHLLEEHALLLKKLNELMEEK
jgi:predicted transcriptional regulator